MIEEIQKQNKLVAVYGRVSTSNQENEGTIETQLLAVTEFANKQGYTIVQKYIDNGWSGDSLARPDLDQLRMDAKKKNWEAVLIYDPDRLARRSAWQEVVIEELQEMGIEVFFVTIPQPKTDEDKIMYKMRGVFTEYERMKIKERFRLGKVRKAKEGHIITTEAPYGYTFILKKGKQGDIDFRQGYYEINESEAEVVKSIFSWVANDGLKLRGVVRKLQELDIPPRKSKRGVWSTSTLSTLVKNKTYIGEGHYGASYAVIPEKPWKIGGYKKNKKTSRKIKPEEEWIKIPTPKIVEEDLFFRAGQRLKANFEMASRNTKNEYLLAGKIWCICGTRRAGEGPQHGKHLYYRCTDRVHSFPLPPTCAEGGLNARICDELVWNKVAGLMSSPELLLKQVDRWMTGQKTKNISSLGSVEVMEKEVAKLKTQEDRYNKAYGAGLFTVEALAQYLIPLREKVSTLESQIQEVKQKEREITTKTIPKEEEIEEFAIKSAEFLKSLSFQAKKAIIGNVVEKIVSTRQQLQVYGYIPITQSNVAFCTEYRNCWSTERGEIHVVQRADEEGCTSGELPILYD
jgi:site-specific DNA recombinase